MTVLATKVTLNWTSAVSDNTAVDCRDEVLACASFMPRAVLEENTLSAETLAHAMPLVRALADFYRVPTPQLELLVAERGFRQMAQYSPGSHVISVSSDCNPEDLLRIVFHEFNHIGQFKTIIAAILADAEIRELYQKREQQLFPPMVEAVREQKLDQMPVYVGIGKLFAASYLRVRQAQEKAALTLDVDEYYALQAVYRDSFIELTATISELDAHRWLKEFRREESLTKGKRLREEREGLSSWSFFAGLRNRAATWIEDRRGARLIREIDELSKEISRKVDDVAGRIASREPDSRSVHLYP